MKPNAQQGATMAKWSCWLLLTVCLAPQIASAQFVSGNELLQWCESKTTGGTVDENISGLAGLAQCAGYVQGVSDALDQVRRVSGTASRCLPNGTGVRQLVDAVLTYLRANTATLSEPASGLVATAVNVNWQCNVDPKDLRK
jgi:Rap1a immunity proteins